ncbi:AAA family ATPase [Capillimicrobium parvum]|uniref:Uncharacterized protein n=1 Tax=Capillimicrobium parvum TaxID=2884022 RepID=A0A9E6XYJ7_9ACTN|nr:AAA family ATPase [Capillimicrobium parvum]UGS36977.1 hypothetical protein DSM104329_03389 [Capillimicrobium parvum]
MTDGSAQRLAATLPGPVDMRETHGAWVLLTGDRALKVRKPVRLPYLDYSTPERRLAAGLAEVELNAPLAPGIYLGVRALVEAPAGLVLGPRVEASAGHALGPRAAVPVPGAVEYAVEMRRFDEDRTMAALCDTGTLTVDQVDVVGVRIAAFHAGAAACPGGGAAPFARRVQADVAEIADLAGERADVDAGALRAFADGALRSLGPELDRRAEAGLRRDGHGDLRAEHVVLDADGPLLVDRLEFDRELRCTDVAADLAFLLMDLELHDARWAADRLVATYERAQGDPGTPRLRALLGWQRAMVRAKIALLREREEELSRLLALADRLAWRVRAPVVLLVAGPPASGKSTLAAQLAERTGLPVVATDPLRKALHGAAPTDRLGPEAYTEQATAEVYAEAGRRAARIAAQHGGAIVDATSRSRAVRRLLLRELGGAAPVVAAVCAARPDVVRERARRRLEDPGRVSDADPEVAARLAAGFEPLDGDPELDLVVHVRTDAPGAGALGELAAALDRWPGQG